MGLESVGMGLQVGRTEGRIAMEDKAEKRCRSLDSGNRPSGRTRQVIKASLPFYSKGDEMKDVDMYKKLANA